MRFGSRGQTDVWAAGESQQMYCILLCLCHWAVKSSLIGPFKLGGQFLFFLKELLAVLAAERQLNVGWITAGLVLPRFSLHSRPNQKWHAINEERKRVSPENNLENYSIHTERENIDRVTHSLTANQLLVAFYQNSLWTSAAPLILCLFQCLTAKSGINPGLASTNDKSVCGSLWRLLLGEVMVQSSADLKLQSTCLNPDDHTIAQPHCLFSLEKKGHKTKKKATGKEPRCFWSFFWYLGVKAAVPF